MAKSVGADTFSEIVVPFLSDIVRAVRDFYKTFILREKSYAHGKYDISINKKNS